MIILSLSKLFGRYKSKAFTRGSSIISFLRSQEDISLSSDENGNQEHSADSTDIVSDQELQGEKDDCSSKEEQQVQAEKDSDIARGENMLLTEETNQPEEDKEKLEVSENE